MKAFIKLLLLALAATLSVYANAQTCAWTKIAGGAQYTLAIKSDGSLWAWGANESGQLGDNSTINKNTPVQIGNDFNWSQVAAGSAHSFGLKSDGTIWSWGANESGQLGDNSYVNKIVPVQVGTSADWVSIGSGLYHTVALKSDGTIWSWGYNGSGQLGDGSTSSRNHPLKIGTDNNWSKIVAGGGHSLALKTDGTLWAWGSNGSGQLGDASTINKLLPVFIGLGWQNIVTLNDHNLAIKTDGTLWSWGLNSSGQLGDNTKISKSSPLQIGFATWKSIATSQDGSLAVKTDGTLWGWGSDQFGQIGDGSTIGKRIPVQVGSDSNWDKIAAGSYHSLGLKSDFTFWSWGLNEKGQCGDASNNTQYLPVQISNSTCVVNELFWIPDANLRTALKTLHPSCFNSSDFLNVADANNLSISVLNISGKGISSLEGIRHFKNVATLNCSKNNLSAIFELPQSIVSVYASQNCFCPTTPVKPQNFPVSGIWEMLPNKASCTVHISNPLNSITTDINTAVPLIIGKALYFNGQSDFVEMPTFSMTETPVTIDFWAKSEMQNSSEPIILNIGSGDGIKVLANTSGNIGFNYGSGSPTKFVAVNEPFEWNHYAITCTGKSGICKIYINGQLIKSDTLANTIVNLGALRLGSGQNSSDFYKGYLHDLRIWKKIRSQSEIQSGVNNFNDYSNTDLIGAWKLNKGSGTIAKDLSTKGFDGNMNGSSWVDVDNTVQYSWSPATYLSASSGTNISFLSPASGTYVYNITATKLNTCKITQAVTIVTNPKAGTDFNKPIQIGLLSQGSVYSNTQNNNQVNGFKNDYGHISDDIFYSFVLNQASNVTISHCNSNISDSYIYLFNSNRTLLALNDDYGPSCSSYLSSISMNLAPGTYYIASEGYYNTTGNINTEVRILPLAPAKGNTLSNPILISDNIGSCFSFTDFKSNGAGFGNDYMAQPSDDIYYKFTMTSSQTVAISNCGSEIYDSYLTLLDGQGNYYASNDDASNCTMSNLHSYIQLVLQPGTYYIVAEGYSNNTGYIKLNFNIVNSNCRVEEVAEAPVTEKKLNPEINVESSSSEMLYPNPASDRAFLSLQNNNQSVTVTVRDLSGRALRILEASSMQTEINTSDLAEGMYYLSFTQNGKLTNLKLQVVK